MVAVYPHSDRAFTQGLVVKGDLLYESTGLYGSSSVRKYDLKSRKLLRSISIAPHLFGEGLALIGQELIQLTWKEQKILIYDADSLKLKKIVHFPAEGWGLCADGENVWMSDGSSFLFQRAYPSFELKKKLQVKVQGKSIERLNALAYAKGAIYANVWGQEQILQINPRTGAVTGILDASSLLKPAEKTKLSLDEVLNGIAFREESGTFLITGKNWPYLFELKVVHDVE